MYRTMGKFGKFGESSVIHQTKLVLTINSLLFIFQTFLLKRANLPPSTFPLYNYRVLAKG